MTTPSSNTLRLALSVLGKSAVSYYAIQSRAVNVNGVYETIYNDPITVYGSLQPVDYSLFEQMGLELQKSYVTFYITKYIQDVTRATAGDQFDYSGRKYQVLSDSNWFSVDGWVGLTAADVGPTP